MFNEATGLVKVGMSNNTKTRAKTISNHCGTVVVVMYESNLISNAELCEKESHKELYRSRQLGEWFDCGVSHAISAVKCVVSEFSVCADYSNQDVNECDTGSGIIEKECAWKNCKELFYGTERAKYCGNTCKNKQWRKDKLMLDNKGEMKDE